ncbi:ribulose-phosphate 3-epimerase [Candidatus Dependentiae bacterium]
MEIFPSLISSDLLNLEKIINNLNSNCDGYHIDVMDDHFVPNLTWGPMFVNSILNITKLPLQIHLMVENPQIWIDRLNLRKIDCFIFHAELFDFAELAIDLIKKVRNKKNCKVGVAVNPKTTILSVFDYLKYLDNILIMSVEPGFSGQKYMSEVESKIKPIKDKKKELNLSFKIGMDGAISKNNIKKLVDLGVDQFGIASAIFSQKYYIKSLAELYKI